MKKREKDALRKAFDIPEPKKKEAFIAEYSELIKKNKRRAFFPMFMKYASTAVFAALIIGVWSNLKVNPNYPDEFGSDDLTSETVPAVTTTADETSSEDAVQTTVSTAVSYVNTVTEQAASSENETVQTVPHISGAANAPSSQNTGVAGDIYGAGTKTEAHSNIPKKTTLSSRKPVYSSKTTTASKKTTAAAEISHPKQTSAVSSKKTYPATVTKAASTVRNTSPQTTVKEAEEDFFPTSRVTLKTTVVNNTTKKTTVQTKPALVSVTTKKQAATNLPATSDKPTHVIVTTSEIESSKPEPTMPAEDYPPDSAMPTEPTYTPPVDDPIHEPKPNWKVPDETFEKKQDAVVIYYNEGSADKPSPPTGDHAPSFNPVYGFIDNSSDIVEATVCDVLYTTMNDRAVTQVNLFVNTLLKCGDTAESYMTLYIYGGYITGRRYNELNGGVTKYPDDEILYVVYNDFDECAKNIGIGSKYIFFLNKGDEKFIEGSYQTVSDFNVSVYYKEESGLYRAFGDFIYFNYDELIEKLS